MFEDELDEFEEYENLEGERKRELSEFEKEKKLNSMPSGVKEIVPLPNS